MNIVPKLLVFLILIFLSACGGDAEKLIQKKWTLNANIFVQKVEKKLNTKLEEEDKKAYINFANSMYADFQPDGVVETNLGGRLQKGSWKLNEAKDKVILERKEGTEILRIMEISGSQLVLAHSKRNIKDTWVLSASE